MARFAAKARSLAAHARTLLRDEHAGVVAAADFDGGESRGEVERT